MDKSIKRYAQSCTICSYPDNGNPVDGNKRFSAGNYTYCEPFDALEHKVADGQTPGVCGVIDGSGSLVPIEASCIANQPPVFTLEADLDSSATCRSAQSFSGAFVGADREGTGRFPLAANNPGVKTWFEQ
eukprot:3683199-Pyramimonas_sp.AAC.5